MTAGRSIEPRVPQAVAWVLVGLAVLNLALGATLALTQPHRANDLLTIQGWCRDWLFDGANPYGIAEPSTDYPPSAIITFAPLALVSPRWIVRLWIVTSLCLAPVLPYVVARSLSLSPRRIVWLSVAAFLCSEHARFVTGTALLVDGGAYAGLQ